MLITSNTNVRNSALSSSLSAPIAPTMSSSASASKGVHGTFSRPSVEIAVVSAALAALSAAESAVKMSPEDAGAPFGSSTTPVVSAVWNTRSTAEGGGRSSPSRNLPPLASLRVDAYASSSLLSSGASTSTTSPALRMAYVSCPFARGMGTGSGTLPSASLIAPGAGQGRNGTGGRGIVAVVCATCANLRIPRRSRTSAAVATSGTSTDRRLRPEGLRKRRTTSRRARFCASPAASRSMKAPLSAVASSSGESAEMRSVERRLSLS
mmetsp:Transcript_7009/g.16011  ORF Transcript_7009/g.16011 Transcript_7009/m.16011 type:complete len:266 (-) Transcript_7009:353-1150(-)